MTSPAIGTVGWLDLTVDDADTLRDFYAAVCGWTSHPVDMGGYVDHAMGPEDGEPVAGVCHARGPNAEQPGGWVPYVVVADVTASLHEAVARGGRVVADRRDPEGEGFAVVADPSDAVLALWQAPRA